MKNLILTVTLLVCLSAVSQQGRRNHHNKRAEHNMTAQQMATLQTKKMTLLLDLTSNQQEEVLKINLTEAEFRKIQLTERKKNKENGEHKKITVDERFEIQNSILDHKIAQQQKMKKILNDEQFNIWIKSRNRKGIRDKKKVQRGGRNG